ncbi:hypothetical protein BDQ12DRAFT_694233 [Crucibulum laeve]|uniref:SnoaL-like domain-containing protein n=1 Tax=Crucibulum laeve TaxID=68775 RepID=A0A5C3LF66_9AGAR|nr:hypothetical protein BDQ12DRAFT_694233 [Crucibulum laeve]
MISAQRQHIIDLFAILDSRDYDSMSKIVADHFTIEFLPASLGGFGVPVRNKDQLTAFLIQLQGTIASYKIKLGEVIETKDIIVAHYKSHGELVHGGPYTNEYIGIFRFEEGKIASISEFMDSKYVSQVIENSK